MGAVKRVKRLVRKCVKNAIDPTPLLRKLKTRRQIKTAQKASKADSKDESIMTLDPDVECTSEERDAEQVSFLDIVQNDSIEDLFVDGILKDGAREFFGQGKVYAGVVQARIIDDEEFLKREAKQEEKLKAQSDKGMEDAKVFIEKYMMDLPSANLDQSSGSGCIPMICVFTVIAVLYLLSVSVHETLSTALNEWLRAAFVQGCEMIRFSNPDIA